jgi:hypothetical protein
MIDREAGDDLYHLNFLYGEACESLARYVRYFHLCKHGSGARVQGLREAVRMAREITHAAMLHAEVVQSEFERLHEPFFKQIGEVK